MSLFLVDKDKCTQCGLCREVCAYCHEELSLDKRDINAWASWSNEYVQSLPYGV